MPSLSKEELVEAAASIYEMAAAGESDDSIMSTLGMDATTFRAAKKFMFDDRIAQAKGKSRELVFVEYALEQRRNIHLVDTLITELSGPEGKRHYNAFVGAIRLRVDITDRILERGFDLGVIAKAAEKHEVIGGLAVAGLSAADLTKMILELTNSTKELCERYGEADILDVSPGELHRGPSVIDAFAEDDEALLDKKLELKASEPKHAPGKSVAKLPPPTERSKPLPAAVPATKAGKR